MGPDSQRLNTRLRGPVLGAVENEISCLNLMTSMERFCAEDGWGQTQELEQISRVMIVWRGQDKKPTEKKKRRSQQIREIGGKAQARNAEA